MGASALSIAMIAVALAAYCIALTSQNTDQLTSTHKIKILGLASGLSSCLPVWWAFLRGGIHNLFGVSREAAWKIHVAFGYVAIIFGLVHGGSVSFAEGVSATDRVWWTLGLIGWVLMLLGVLPADVYMFCPKFMRYDTFKLWHYLSLLGFILSVLHMADHALATGSADSWIVFLLNASAVVFLMLQKIFLKAKGCQATVRSVEVSDEASGKHIFLKLGVQNFSFQAGQWGHLVVPSLTLVPHPFTIVPSDDNGVQFFMKVSGKFTEKLAQACSRGTDAAPKIVLEGPYGIPALPEPQTNAAVFVVGGVGVTPALSLARRACEAYGDNVFLYWSCRSHALLVRCENFLECVNPSRRCVCFTGSATAEALPLGAKTGRTDLAAWITSTAQALSSAQVTKATLFCCGPKGLCTIAVNAAVRSSSSVQWRVHVEEFSFLPSVCPPTSSRRLKLVEPVGIGKGDGQ